MSENLDPQNQQPEIIRDDFTTKDSTVVIDEKDRTVLLTEDETIIIEKQPTIDIAPRSRPRKVNLGMFGTTEYIVVGLGLLSMLATFLFYMFVVTPAQAQLNNRKAERDRIEKELASTSDKFKDFTTTEEQVAKLVASVDDFETRFLPVSGNGRTALYQRLNTLIAGYGLVNTSGPDYAPLEINQREGQSEGERGRTKYQSLFPGVYVTMTVEGTYQNLRRFLRDIETSQQFIIVSAVELEPAEGQDKSSGNTVAQTLQQQQQTLTSANQPYARQNINPTGAVPNPAMRNPGPVTTTTTTETRPAPRGKTIGETVSLRIELAAYFKRNSASSLQPQQQQQ
jgi:hypothetical protein